MSITVTPLHATFAARVEGADLTQPIDEATADVLRDAIDTHGVLVFPGEKLTEDQQIDFANLFGTLDVRNGIIQTGIKQRISERLVDISNIDDKGQLLDRQNRRRMANLGNQLWHTDASFKATTAKYSLLHAHTVVSEGGETQYADMCAAYDALPQKMKDKIADLEAEHSVIASRASMGFMDFSDEERAALPPQVRPLVRELPSGRTSLYLASHASHIIGWPIPEGRMLIRDLMEHATQREFVYTHNWEIGDLVMWDNRRTMHRARPFDESEARDMRRATVMDPDWQVSRHELASTG
ncbi:MAG: TauD/TfdA family dioxygenase [Rhodospirillales bacterium]|nr:TauD/TfdA family dioxygenase [Rhodospirillales bacterium]